MAKGIIFNLDVIFAVLIASMFIVTITMMQMPTPANIELERAANDISATLDKISALGTLNATLISSNLSIFLPPNTDADMSIYCYVYNSSSGAFVSDKNITISSIKNSTQTKPVITSVRYFPAFNTTTVSDYCTSRLEVWGT